MSGTRLPIFHDDINFRDRDFGDISRKMHSDLARHGFGTGTRIFPKWSVDDDMDNIMGNDFFQLRPRPPQAAAVNPKVSAIRRDDFGSRESLDDDQVNNCYKTNPKTLGRNFEISFDVRDYDPNEISVRVKDDTLLIEAKHVETRDGGKSVREFNRKVAVPKDVDIDKLSSALSQDGVLTVSAPVSPNYHQVAQGPYRRPDVSPSPIPLPGHGAVRQTGSPGHASPRGYGGGGFTSPDRTASPGGGAASPSSSYNQYHPPHLHHQSSSSGGQRFSPGGSHHSASPSPRPGPPQTSPPYHSPHHQQQVTPVLPLDTPVYSATDNVGGRKMDLMLDMGRGYTPEDLVVKIEGAKLMVEAEHVEKLDGKSSRTSMHREFDVTEEIDPRTVQAMLRTDGKLVITASVMK